MAWEPHSKPQDGFTLWRDREQGFWRVTEDYHNMAMRPNADLNHPRSKKAAIAAWREKQVREAGHESEPVR